MRLSSFCRVGRKAGSRGRYVMPLLAAAGRRVVALDPRGMGDSDRRNSDHDIRTAVAEVHDFTEAVELTPEGPIGVVGHDGPLNGAITSMAAHTMEATQQLNLCRVQKVKCKTLPAVQNFRGYRPQATAGTITAQSVPLFLERTTIVAMARMLLFDRKYNKGALGSLPSTFISIKPWNSLTGTWLSGRILILIEVQFRPKRLAQGVFALLESPALRHNCIVGHRGVLVIDSGINGPMARQIRASVQTTTKAPMLYWLIEFSETERTHESSHFDGPMELERGRHPKRSFARSGTLVPMDRPQKSSTQVSLEIASLLEMMIKPGGNDSFATLSRAVWL